MQPLCRPLSTYCPGVEGLSRTRKSPSWSSNSSDCKYTQQQQSFQSHQDTRKSPSWWSNSSDCKHTKTTTISNPSYRSTSVNQSMLLEKSFTAHVIMPKIMHKTKKITKFYTAVQKFAFENCLKYKSCHTKTLETQFSKCWCWTFEYWAWSWDSKFWPWSESWSPGSGSRSWRSKSL